MGDSQADLGIGHTRLGRGMLGIRKLDVNKRYLGIRKPGRGLRVGPET